MVFDKECKCFVKFICTLKKMQIEEPWAESHLKGTGSRERIQFLDKNLYCSSELLYLPFSPRLS
jgi:hypothetical protein